jgi:hypothetical protein
VRTRVAIKILAVSAAAAGAVASVAAIPGCMYGDPFYRYDGATSGGDDAAAPGSGGAPAGGSGGAPAGGSGGALVGGTGGRPAGTGGMAAAGGTGGRPGSGGAVVGPGPSFFDDFEDGTATEWYPSDTAAPAWAVVMDGATKVFQQGTLSSERLIAVRGDVAWTDQAIEARVKLISGSSSARMSLVARLKDLDNYYLLQLEDEEIQVRRVLNGSSTTLTRVKMANAARVAIGTWYSLKLVVRGSTVVGYVKDAAAATYTATPEMADTTPLTNGAVGVAIEDAAAAFDDVRVTPP